MRLCRLSLLGRANGTAVIVAPPVSKGETLTLSGKVLVRFYFLAFLPLSLFSPFPNGIFIFYWLYFFDFLTIWIFKFFSIFPLYLSFLFFSVFSLFFLLFQPLFFISTFSRFLSLSHTLYIFFYISQSLSPFVLFLSVFSPSPSLNLGLLFFTQYPLVIRLYEKRKKNEVRKGNSERKQMK